ncbi:uncharacterized protein LOC134202140 [Armigeres subalbatus]|uniref:uncharacterized protein LOC134202140 n=2 Tax=Armigeres subalbatus TaxID=124917 RepID=UPI002ED5CCE6
MTSVYPLRIFDEKFNYIYKICLQTSLPPDVAFTLCDKNFPAESFGTLTVSEWEAVLAGTVLSGTGQEVFRRISQWKTAQAIGPNESCIPPLEPSMYMFQLEPSDIQPDAQQFSGTMNTPCIESNDADPRKLSEKTGGDNCPTGGVTSGMMCKVEPLGSDTDRNCRSVTVSNTVQKYEICYNMMEADFEKQIDEQNSNDFASTATNVQQEAYSEKQIDELDSDGLVSDGTDDKQDSGEIGKLAVNISGVTKLSDVSNNMGISAAGAISPLLYEQQDASAVGVSSGVLKPTIDLQPQFANTPFFSPDDLSHLLAKSDVGQAIIQNSLKGPLSKDSRRN